MRVIASGVTKRLLLRMRCSIGVTLVAIVMTILGIGIITTVIKVLSVSWIVFIGVVVLAFVVVVKICAAIVVRIDILSV